MLPGRAARRYRGSGSVADVGDLACHGILAQAERRGYRGVDPRIRLMSDQAVNVAHLPADRGQRLRSRRAHPFDRLPVNLASGRIHWKYREGAVSYRSLGSLS